MKSLKIFFFSLIGVLCLRGTFLTAQSVKAADLSSLPRTIEITDQEQSYSHTIREVPKITLNGSVISADSFPLFPVNAVWMAAGEQFFRQKLGFGYLYEQQTQTVTLKNPYLNTTIVLTVGSKTAQVNGTDFLMEEKVYLAKDIATGEMAVILPFLDILNESGYTVQMTNQLFQLTNDLVFHQMNSKDTFDPSQYSNRLEGVYIEYGSQSADRIFQFSTEKISSSSQIQVTDQWEECAVTITLLKTKNSLSDLSKTFSTGAITKISIKENGQKSTVIKIWYQKKYMYTKQFLDSGMSITFSKATFDLKVLLPSKVKFSKITTTDQYWKKKFMIILPGNYVSYYKKNKPIINNSVIKNISVSKTAAKNTKLTITTKKLQGYRLISSNGYFTVKVGSPQSIYKNIVMLDPGHGGKDAGASKYGLKEKKLNFSILYTYAKKYFDALNSPVKAYWTRYNDTKINLYARPTYSKKYHADLFVSLHMNSSPRKSANGMEVYYSKNNNRKNSAGLTSRIFAKKMLTTLANDLNGKKRGVKQAGFVVVKYNTVPSVLIELGFVSGSKDHKKLRKKSYQMKAAKSIYRGVCNVFKAYPTGR